MKRKRLSVAEIYCGAGGLSAGFKNATAWWDGADGQGFEVVYGVDRDKDAISTFRAFHFSGKNKESLETIAPCKDVTAITGAEILTAIKPHRRLDVLIGGPSCQGVSPAGLRNPNDNRNAMLLAFIRLVKELRPRWFLMENVPGLTHANNRELLATIFREFESIEGYEVAGDVLLAADHDVPQLRYRLFIIGTNTGAPIRFPTPKDAVKYQYPTVRKAIFDLTDVEPNDYCHTRIEGCDGLSRTPPNHYCRSITSVNKTRMKSIRPGEDWRFMPIKLLPEGYFGTRASDQKGAYGRLLWDWPAYTITNSCLNLTAGVFTHPIHHRVLSVREAARIQSFEDHHVFYGSLESQYRQVGNAVPPKLARAVAEAILYCHYERQKAITWGRAGRLSSKITAYSIENPEVFPVLTQRQVHPVFDRRVSRKTVKHPTSQIPIKTSSSVWDCEQRPPDSRPAETRRLRKLAKQPGNYRAAKRARTILQFMDGVPKKTILEQANVSETSIKKWVDGYFREGLDGWRAYHTPIHQIRSRTPAQTAEIKKAVNRVRRTLLSPPKKNFCGEPNGGSRLHMNNYLLTLIGRFGNLSVADLIWEVEDKLAASIGTVYVGDLLAIADVVLGTKVPRAEGARKQFELSTQDPVTTVKGFTVHHSSNSASNRSRVSNSE